MLNLQALDQSPASMLMPSEDYQKAQMRRIHVLARHSDSVLSLAVADHRDLLYTGAQDGVILVWELNNFGCVGELVGHKRQITHLHIPEKRFAQHELMLSSARDNCVRAWDLQSRQCIYIFTNFASCIFSLTSIDERIYGGCMDTSIFMLDLERVFSKHAAATKGSELDVLEFAKFVPGHIGYVYTLLVSADKSVLISASGDFTIRLWSPALKLVQVLEGHTDSVTCLALHADHTLFSGSADGMVKVWSLRSDSVHLVRSLSVQHRPLSLLVVCNLLFVSIENGDLLAFDLSCFRLVRSGPLHSKGNVLCLTNSSKYILSGGTDSLVCVWCLEGDGRSLMRTKDSPLVQSRPFAVLQSIDTVEGILARANLPELRDLFRDNHIDIIALRLLQDSDLAEIGVPLGSRRKLISAANTIAEQRNCSFSDNLIDTLEQVVAIESVSNDSSKHIACWNCAKFLEGFLQSIGAATRLRQVRSERSPILMARFGDNTDSGTTKPKIVIYAHYDVMPALEKDWRTSPFELTGVNGFLYGRGASDNKGPIVAFLYAIKELTSEFSSLPVDIVLILEGEGERDSFSGGLEAAIEASKDWLEDVSTIVLANTVWVGGNRPCLNYGMRGVINMQIDVNGPSHDMHSGVHGGSFSEPMNDMVQVLSSLTDSTGKVCIDGFYETVRPLDEFERSIYENLDFDIEEYRKEVGLDKLRSDSVIELLMRRWREPSLSIHAISGSEDANAGAFSIISKQARAKVSLRTVPDQDSDTIIKNFTTHIEKSFADLDSSNSLSVECVHRGNWWLGDPNSVFFKAAAQAIETIWGEKPLLIREGGTMTSAKFLETCLNAPSVHIPFGQSSDQAHLGNERIRIINLMRGKDVFKEFVKSVATHFGCPPSPTSPEKRWRKFIQKSQHSRQVTRTLLGRLSITDTAF